MRTAGSVLFAVLLASSCEKSSESAEPTEATPAAAPEETVDEEPEPRGPAGEVTLKLALDPDESETFCCDAGKGESGTGCRKESNEAATDECLREGLFAFTCTGTVVRCDAGACSCGAPTAQGKRLCCTSVEGNEAKQCSNWNDSDYTACEDNGRQFKMCASPRCKDGSTETGFDCTCG